MAAEYFFPTFALFVELAGLTGKLFWRVPHEVWISKAMDAFCVALLPLLLLFFFLLLKYAGQELDRIGMK